MRSLPLVPLFALLLACGDSGSSTTDTATETPGTGGDTPAGTDTDVPPTTGGELCGNTMIDGNEDCDGSELGGTACADVDPGKPNGALVCAANCKFDTSGCAAAGAAFVALNEVTSRGADVGPYAGLGDAVELYNPGPGAVDISGWKLSDDATFPTDKTYEFPPGTTIAAAEYKVLVARDAVTMLGDFPFGISDNNEEVITLADANGDQVDQVIFSGVAAAIAYCRLPDGTGAWQMCDSTLGGANIAASMICGNNTVEGNEDCEGSDVAGATCQQLGYTGGTLACNLGCEYDVGGCTQAVTVILNELESEEDKIEIFNHGDEDVDISGWILTDEADPGETYEPGADNDKLVFPPDSILPANTYLVVARGDLPGQHPFGLGSDGDTVSLFQPDLTIVDSAEYPAELASISYCRFPDGPGNTWVADCIPTFGGPNQKP